LILAESTRNGAPCAADADDRSERGGLDRIADLGAGAVQLDILNCVPGHPGGREGLTDAVSTVRMGQRRPRKWDTRLAIRPLASPGRVWRLTASVPARCTKPA
jgi:hypothetical protein